MENETETYILLLLSDSNLPTGSFVASSGLESFLKHGFPPSQSKNKTEAIAYFIEDCLTSYAHSSLAFVSDAHRVVTNSENAESAKEKLCELDMMYDTMTLNSVTRRASRAQGVALLTLYSKGFAAPTIPLPGHPSSVQPTNRDNALDYLSLIDNFKLLVRKEDTHGHLPVCWGILTAALGLSLERTQYLHLFLFARSLLSAAVRLNAIGPYTSQQLLLHRIRPLITRSLEKCRTLRTGIVPSQVPFKDTRDGPVNTWPLGEILAARHDLQHSRIFNS